MNRAIALVMEVLSIAFFQSSALNFNWITLAKPPDSWSPVSQKLQMNMIRDLEIFIC